MIVAEAPIYYNSSARAPLLLPLVLLATGPGDQHQRDAVDLRQLLGDDVVGVVVHRGERPSAARGISDAKKLSL